MTGGMDVDANGECVVVTAQTGQQFTLVAGPSGVINWQYGTGGGPDLAGLVVPVAAFAWNALGRLAFRFGWSVAVFDKRDRRIARHRYRSKKAALEALPLLGASYSKDASTSTHPAGTFAQNDRAGGTR